MKNKKARAIMEHKILGGRSEIALSARNFKDYLTLRAISDVHRKSTPIRARHGCLRMATRSLECPRVLLEKNADATAIYLEPDPDHYHFKLVRLHTGLGEAASSREENSGK